MKILTSFSSIQFPRSELLPGQKVAVYQNSGDETSVFYPEYVDIFEISTSGSNSYASWTVGIGYVLFNAASRNLNNIPVLFVFTDGTTDSTGTYVGDAYLFIAANEGGVVISNPSYGRIAYSAMAESYSLTEDYFNSYASNHNGAILSGTDLTTSDVISFTGTSQENFDYFRTEYSGEITSSSLFSTNILRINIANTYNVLFKALTATAPTQLSSPTGLSADQITKNSARVKWESVANATGYKVEYRENGSSTWIEG